MMLGLAVSHVDLTAALRLVAWMGFLSARSGGSLKSESLVIVASRRSTGYPMFAYLPWLAAGIFGKAYLHIPDTEHEVGWPGAANWMFARMLEHVETHFRDDLLFLEPDAIPVKPDWLEDFKSEWQKATSNGKRFMGARVPHSTPHMTGVAVYSANWRSVAPELVRVPDHDAWDCYAAANVLPNCHETHLVQHVFKRSEPGWECPHVGIVNPGVALFHQDKKGKLMQCLDRAHFDLECRSDPMFSYVHLLLPQKVMRKYYYAQNSTLPIKAHGRMISFDHLEQFAGSTPGVYSTDNDEEQAALETVTRDATTGVTQITAAEWEGYTKKKAPEEPHSTRIMNAAWPPLPIKTTPSKSPATLVAEPTPRGSDNPADSPPLKDINSVAKTAQVKSAHPNIGSQRPRKTPKQSAPEDL